MPDRKIPQHSERALLAEAMMWDYERDFMPDGMQIVERDDVLMWKRPRGPLAQRRWSNRVSHVRTSTDRVERIIDEVLAFFGPVPFTWVVGPSSRPNDLAGRLASRGLVDIGDGDLLTATLPIAGLRVRTDLEIVEVADEGLALTGLRLAHPDADEAEMTQLLRERLAYLRHPGRQGGYLVAFLAGEPVANAGYRFSSDGSTVYLTGAETVERFRRRGIYQTLVAHRAAAAEKLGCRHAAIRARSDTSLPILTKRGFIDHGHLPIFAPPEPVAAGRTGVTRIDPELARRLTEVGVDPADPGEPAAAWRRLNARFGPRATLLDRYALEAAHRGVRPEELSVEERRRLTLEVLTIRSPGFEIIPGSGRAASDPIKVVAYDERWLVLFADWREKLRRALGKAAVRIEHIGSTAVPGLAAKPVIDIQVGIRDLEDEPSYVPAIEGVGVALRARELGHRYFRPAGPLPRTVQIHVYQAGSAEEREHLLFRDYLRAHPHARDAYARMKREVAGRYRDDRIAYNEAKTGFILDELDRARDWARRTGV